jgi:hypothetical protein
MSSFFSSCAMRAMHLRRDMGGPRQEFKSI